MSRIRYAVQTVGVLDIRKVNRTAVATRTSDARCQARRLLAIILDHATMHDQVIVGANIAQYLAAVGAERVKVAEGIGVVSKTLARRDQVSRAILRKLGVGFGATGAEHRHGMPIEVTVVLIPVHLSAGQSEESRPVPYRRATSRIAVVPDLLAARVARAVPDLVHRLGFSGRETVGVGRSATIGDADRTWISGRAVIAGAWIVNKAVRDAIKGVARCNSLGGREVLFAGRDHATDQILHDDLAPHLRGLEPCPVHRWGTCQNAVEFVGQFLSEDVTPAATGRTAVPVVVFRRRAVVVPGRLLREQDFLDEAYPAPVVEVLKIVRAVEIYSLFAAAGGIRGAGVAAIGGRRGGGNAVGGVRGRGARASAAAARYCSPVPAALVAAGSAINRIRRQFRRDTDVLGGRAAPTNGDTAEPIRRSAAEHSRNGFDIRVRDRRGERCAGDGIGFRSSRYAK